MRFLIFALKHRLLVLVKMKIVQKIKLKIVIFTAVKNRCLLHGRGFYGGDSNGVSIHLSFCGRLV